MKAVQLFLFLAVFGAYNFANAGTGTHGGNSVVCYNSNHTIKSIELYDYWEQMQETSNKYQLDLGAPILSVKEKISYVLKKLEKVDPVKAANYLNAANNILGHMGDYLLAGSDLAQVNDDNGTLLPQEPCFKRRFAAQRTNAFEEQKKFFIVKEFYDVATNDVRAGIILHEVIYQEAIKNGATNSDGVRYFNFLLSSTFFDQMIETKYLSLISQVGLPSSDAVALQIIGASGSVFLDIKNYQLHSDGTVSGTIIATSNGQSPVTIDDQYKTIDLAPGMRIWVDKHNNLMFIMDIGTSKRVIKKYKQQNLRVVPAADLGIKINRKGLITEFTSLDPFPLQSQNLMLSLTETSRFNNDDEPVELRLDPEESYDLQIAGGTSKLSFVRVVYLYSGLVEKGILKDVFTRFINGKTFSTPALTRFLYGQVLVYEQTKPMSGKYKGDWFLVPALNATTPDLVYEQKYIDAACEVLGYQKGLSYDTFTFSGEGVWDLDRKDEHYEMHDHMGGGYGMPCIKTVICGGESRLVDP